MTCNLNLQRNSKIFYSTIDIDGGAAVGDMTPSNTWEVEVLAGYAVAQDAATQDITTLESGTSPDRATARFNTAFNPVEWNFQCYLRPTGVDDASKNADSVSATANVKPISDWFMWQALMSNTAPADSSGVEQSAWEDEGIFRSVARAAAANVHAHSTNISTALEKHLYIKMDNVIYQVSNAAVNEGSIDAAIDGIATTTWTGMGTNLIELTGTKRNNAVAVFGGTLNNGTSVTSNSNALAISRVASYHPWASYNVSGTLATASFIKNRLSTIDIFHTPENGAAVNYTFPVTALSWTWNNNITYLIPEELARLNSPIGNFTGARQITGSFSAYLRHHDADSAQFLRNIVNDRRTSHSTAANANIKIGGETAPFFATYHPSVQYNLPTHAIEDVIQIQVEFLAQESDDGCGSGDELTIFTKKS